MVELNLIKVKCEKCKVQYYIKWVDITSAKKYSVEFCPNCGETDFLEIIKTIKAREVK